MSEEKENILERNPFFKTRKLLRQSSKQNVKDNDLIQLIYHFIESERRKGVSLENLKEDSSLAKVFEYIGEIDNSVLDIFKDLSDRQFELSYARSKRFNSLGFYSNLQFIKYKFLNCNSETHIKLNGSLKYLPWELLENENIYLHYCLYKNPDENLLNEEVRIILVKYLFKDRVIIEPGDKVCDYIIYANREMGSLLRDVYFKCAEIDDNQTIIVLGDYTENGYYKEDRLLSLLKGGNASLVVKNGANNFYSISTLVLQKHSTEVCVLSPVIVFHKDEATFNFEEFVKNNSFSVSLNQVKEINNLSELLSPHKMLFTPLTKHETVKLGSLASFSYGYAESYQYDESDDPLALVIERSELDEKGGIKSISDIKKWHHVSNSFYHASLLQNNDIYITRKSSAVKVGIFDENTLMRFAPRSKRNEEKLSAYLFASPIIIRVNEDIPVYYVMAYLYTKMDGFSTLGKNHFFTIKPIQDIDVPILTKPEMQQIADEFKENYLQYLKTINYKSDAILKMDKITKGFN